MTKRFQLTLSICTVLFVAIALAMGLLFFAGAGTASADGIFPSDVMSDLATDPSFIPAQWPQMAGCYDLELITIAEGKDDRLYVYVYQPGCSEHQDYRASYIRLSETIDDEIAPKDYSLVFCDRYGVFYKYYVDNFSISHEDVRYYAAIQLMRPYVDGIDVQADNGNFVTQVPFQVNRQYRFVDFGDETLIEAVDIETVVITDKFVGFVRYVDDPFFMINSACDSHFVAFNTDHVIDDLLEADVEFYSQEMRNEKVHWFWDNIMGGYTTVYYPEYPEDGEPSVVTLYSDDIGTFDSNAYFTADHHYEWKRISTVEDFIHNVELDDVFESGIWRTETSVRLTDVGRPALEDKQWVLQFVETPYRHSEGLYGASDFLRTAICDVSILRLKFRCDGVVYNLGVVDNMQGLPDAHLDPDPDPINTTEQKTEIRDLGEVLSDFWSNYGAILQIVLSFILLVLLLVVLWPIMPYIIRFIVWVLSLPIKLIKGIGEAAKKRKKEKQQKG